MKFILGTKVNMTEVFDDKGIVHGATLITAGPVVVTQVKTEKTDGYDALQLGFGKRSEKNLSKAVKGHTGERGMFANLKEVRTEGAATAKVGDIMDVSLFKEGDIVRVSSVSKGKGFQGVVKRHGFGGGRRTHGQKHSEREPGSIGGGLRTRVPKGMRMAGRMGGDRITSKNLTIVKIDAATNSMLIRGAVAGRRGTLVEIMAA